jgi:NAD(P)-dependent dehydrogenase (short-subunit alcohol dehydrogenase family)
VSTTTTASGVATLLLLLPCLLLLLCLQQHWDNMFTAGVRCALTASHAAAAMMVQQGSGLIVNVTAWNDGRWAGNMAGAYTCVI